MSGTRLDREGVVLDPELLETQLGEAHVFSRLVPREIRCALIRSETGKHPLWHLPAIHEVLVAPERTDARFERCEVRVKLLNRRLETRNIRIAEENGTERGRDEDMVFL